jgi:CRP-like cAMP-binding protein
VDVRSPPVDAVTREQRPGSFWRRLSPEARSEFAKVGEEKRFPRHATLIRAAAVGSCVVVLISGRVRVVSEDGKRVVATREAGDVIGEQAFLDNRVRSATVLALSHVRALVVTREKLDRLLADHPAVLRLLSAVVSERLRESDAALLDRGDGTADKVVRFLVNRAASGQTIYIRSQSELAEELGISRASVGRALAQLRRNGLIVTERSRISIRDLAALKQRVTP